LGLKDQEQADQAARALAQIGVSSVPELMKALQEPKREIQKRALSALGTLGPEAREAARPVAEFLTNKDPKMRALAAEVLAEMGPAARPAGQLLSKALCDSDSRVRTLAAEALHELGLDTVTHLLTVLKDKHLPVRLSTLQSLAFFHESKEAVDALVNALRDPQVPIRATAAATLVRLGPERSQLCQRFFKCSMKRTESFKCKHSQRSCPSVQRTQSCWRT
jgi:HEAT repeat protein